ncbi:MAG: DUF4389 domain-containing protein [Desulfococcaceae bacterium]|jgi:hypothetical protein|nr:DUF4389 domain-containing protein [Desulfococcaceae bacterium]
MNKVKEILSAMVKALLRAVLVRKKIAVRFLFAFLFTAIWGIANIFILFLIFFQYIWLFITTRQSGAIKGLSHKIIVYTYKILRYISLNEAAAPYPFSKFPKEIEDPEEADLSVELPEEPPAADSGKADTQKSEDKAAASAQTSEKSDDDVQQTIIPDHKNES